MMVGRFRRARQVRHLCSSRPEALQALVPELEIELRDHSRSETSASLGPALDSQHPVAIELDFVFPIRTLRQLRDRKALHRFDESSRPFCTAL
jgi:hypothetical protein